MRRCIFLLFLFIFLGVTLPQHQAQAVRMKGTPEGKKGSTIFEEHDPGTTAEGPFPLVYYMFDSSYSLSEAIQQDPMVAKLYPDGTVLPEYLGYLVVTKDFRLAFVNKSRRDLGITAKVDALNALGKDGRYYYKNKPIEDPDAWWVPRWSYHAIWEIVNDIILGYRSSDMTGYKAFVTYGIPPDDAFVPEYSRMYRVTLEDLKQPEKFILYTGEWEVVNNPAGGPLRIRAEDR